MAGILGKRKPRPNQNLQTGGMMFMANISGKNKETTVRNNPQLEWDSEDEREYQEKID